MVYERVVNVDDAILGIAGVKTLLPFSESDLVESGYVPGRSVKPAVEAGLIGGVDELGVYAVDGFALGEVKTGEIFAAMMSLTLILEKSIKNNEHLLDRFWKANDGRHESPVATFAGSHALVIAIRPW
jgi:hypothetical protein